MIINIPQHLIDKSNELFEHLLVTPAKTDLDVRSRFNARVNVFNEIGGYVHAKIQKKQKEERKNGKSKVSVLSSENKS